MRRVAFWLGVVGAAAVLAACGKSGTSVKTVPGGTTTRLVIPSDVYASRVGFDAQRARITELEEAVTRLRTETGSSGWQARQDDVTGKAGELSGGIFQAPRSSAPLEAVREFLQRHGAALGLTDPGRQLRFPDSLVVDETGAATFRSPQVHHEDIEVDGASVLVALSRAAEAPEISLVRGRIFDTRDVPPRPSVSEADARSVVSQIAGGQVTSPLVLTVYTGGTRPSLAWQTDVATQRGDPATTTAGAGVAIPSLVSGPSRVFVDAQDGALLEVRPLTTDFLGAGLSAHPAFVGAGRGGVVAQAGSLPAVDPQLPAAGPQVEARGDAVGGVPVTVAAEQHPGGIALIDSTLPNADRGSARNTTSIHDGSRFNPQSSDLNDLPGPVLLFPGTEIADTDSLTAAWAARQVLEYFAAEHGRQSYDGQGAPLVSTMHIPNPEGTCEINGAFLSAPGNAQMLYGEPCVVNGNPIVTTWVDLGVVAHEVMHGVTGSHAQGLGDVSSQSQALDEGISDYFGVVIQNRVFGTDHTTVGVLICGGVPDSSFCLEQPDGNRGVRSVASGATFDDFEFVLHEPLGFAGKTVDTDHQNALVITNALWEIRTRLAALDGGDVNNSPTAKAFDRAVYRAVTRYFTGSTDFLAAAEAVQRAATEIPELTAREHEVIRRQFLESKLCRGCTAPTRTARPVAVNGNVKLRPQMAGPGIVYTEYAGRLQSQGLMASLDGGQAAQPVSQEKRLTLFAVAAGDYAVDLVVDVRSDQGTVNLRNLRTGQREQLSATPGLAQPSVSDDAVAWFDAQGGPNGALAWRPIEGGDVVMQTVPNQVNHLAVDGQLVAFQLADGTLGIWDTTSGDLRQLASLPTPSRPLPFPVQPGGIAMHNGRVAAIAFNGSINDWLLVVFDTAGNGAIVSDRVSPFGVTMRDDLLLWSENVGVQSSKVADSSGTEIVDSDIEAYSFATDTFYRILPQRGQQGFPSYDGQRLVWQDAALGGDDIFTVALPSGL